MRALLPVLLTLGLSGCEEFLSDPSLPIPDITDTAAAGAPDCIGEDPFGAVVCDRYYTDEEVPDAISVAWIDNDDEIASINFTMIKARADGEEWQEHNLEVDVHSEAPNGNRVIGLTFPNAPRDSARIEVGGTVWYPNKDSIDLCDLETGVLVTRHGAQLHDYYCGTRFTVDW